MASVSLPILVTGASGHLGRELACQLAGPGVHLSLWGRDEARLELAARACRAKGATTSLRCIDLADTATARAAFEAEDATTPFELVLLVAGQGLTTADHLVVEDPAQIARQCHLNFTATAALAGEAAKRLCERKGGRIGIIGSAAAFHSLPFAPSYAASKAGLARFADALRLATRPHGVTVTLATPGFIAPENPLPGRPRRPFEMRVEQVARIIISSVEAGRAERIIPRWFVLLKWFDRALPRVLRDRLLSILPRA